MKTNIRSYIKVFDGFTKEQCEVIITSLDNSKSVPHVFVESRTNTEYAMGKDPKISFLKDEKIDPIGHLIKSQWHKLIGQYILEFLKEEKMGWYDSWNGFSFPKFLEYNEGTLLPTHCDHIFTLFEPQREVKEYYNLRGVPIISLITALNDDYSGGEITMCERYKYRLKAGETLIFPSNFLYPHEIKEITKGTRHSMVSWVY